MKKINNKKMVLRYARLLICLIFLLAFIGSVLLLLKPIDFYLLPASFCIAGFVVSFYTFTKLRIFEYENAVFYTTIKQSYLWKNQPEAPIEFPNDILISFNIYKKSFITLLVLVIRSKEQKSRKLYCKIAGLNNRQILELKKSLKNAED